MKSNYFYSDEDIKALKETIRTGEPLKHIAARLYVQYETTENALLNKLYKIKARTYKISKWNGPKRIVSPKAVKPSISEVSLPEGFTFEGTPKKVTVCTDHFRIYF